MTEFESLRRTAAMLRADCWHLEAAEVYHRLLQQRPTDPSLWADFGTVLTDLRFFDEAQSAYRAALEIDPDCADAYSAMGNSLMLTYDFQDAEDALRKALAINPTHAIAMANLGDAFLATERVEEALSAYRQAIEIAPGNPAIHLHYANALLLTGDLVLGFAEYEWRWRVRPALPDPQRCPLLNWDGGSLDGKTIRIYAEQGHGDALQFIRYAPMVADKGGKLVLLARKPLSRLLSNAPGVARIEEISDKAQLHPGRDCDLGLLSLPRLFKTSLSNIPAPIPYLSADPCKVEIWRRRLSSLPGLKVGLVWAGEPRPDEFENHLIDSRRSMKLATMAPLAGVSGVSFVSLQKGEAAKEERPEGFFLFDAMNEMEDFADTAALVAALDLVISVDTSTAHLAGALGRPVWILSRHDGCWRWLLERRDSPWYPTACVFRQRQRGDWPSVIAEIRNLLEEKASIFAL